MACDDQEKKLYYLVEETLFELDNKYSPIEKIGSGGFGVVCSALNTETKEKVAIKKITNALCHDDDALQVLREMVLLRNIKHHNVIALKDVMLPSDTTRFNDVCLVYELMDTDLGRLIRRKRKLSRDRVQYLFFQFLQGLEYLHSAHVLHRDLKPNNLFITAESELKIGDFGLATTINGDESEEDFMSYDVGTQWYRAPELLVGCNNYGFPADVWSMGCVFAELLGGKPIFRGSDTIDQLIQIIDILGTPCKDDLNFIRCPEVKKYIEELPYSRRTPFSELYPNADKLAIDLLEKLLVFNPKHRLTVTQVLQHPYFSVYDYDPNENPPAEKPLSLGLDDGMQLQMIRQFMRIERRHYHPEAEDLQSDSKRRRTS